MTTGTPFISNVSSSFSLTVGSRSSLCWNPLHPPPTTRSRRWSFSVTPPAACSAMIRRTSSAAFGVMMTFGAVFGVSLLTPRAVGSATVDMGKALRVGVEGIIPRGSAGRPGGDGGLLLLVVLDRRLDRVLSQHRAVHLHRR